MDELAAPTDPGRAGRLPRSRRVAGALIGLAVTVALVLALLAIAGGRVAQAPLAPTQGIDWQSATRVAAGRWDFGPFLASAGGRLFMVGQGHSTATPSGSGIVQSIGPITVWSSADGLTWDQVSEPGSFEASTSRFSPLAFSDDGNGGLIVVGNTAVGKRLAARDGVALVGWSDLDPGADRVRPGSGAWRRGPVRCCGCLGATRD